MAALAKRKPFDDGGLMRSKVKPSIAGQPAVPPEIGQLVERLARRAATAWGRPHATCWEVARVNQFQALIEYNPERGVALSSYVAFVVQGALIGELGFGPIHVGSQPDGGMSNLIPARDMAKLLASLDRRPVAREAVSRVLGSATSWEIEDAGRKMNRPAADVRRLFAEGVKMARDHHKEGRTPKAVMAARCAVTPAEAEVEPVIQPRPQLVMVEPPAPPESTNETPRAAFSQEAPVGSLGESPTLTPVSPVGTGRTSARSRQDDASGQMTFPF